MQAGHHFVELFSDKVLQTAIHPLFQGGNVVLIGTQGCGKTMILNLLRPEIRIAYWEAGQSDSFPITNDMRDFVSAGVNITRSRILDLVQVPLNGIDEEGTQELPLYFGDYFNYIAFNDIIKSIETIQGRPDVFQSLLSPARIERFARRVANNPCWFGALNGVQSMADLKQRVIERIVTYRSWVNGNSIYGHEPPPQIQGSKTNIGEPLSWVAECLHHCEVIACSVPVLIRVDQVEDLHRAVNPRRRVLLGAFRKVLNRLFSARDASVHYRAGSRRYGWDNREFLGIWGSEALLEERRDYLLIDMDEQLFRRTETPNYVFDRFAIDAFQRRVSYYYKVDASALRPELAKSVFGRHPRPENRLKQLTLCPSDTQIDRALGLDVGGEKGRWTEEWRSLLHRMYRSGHRGMLDAALAAAWGRQTGGARLRHQHRNSPPPTDTEPWRNREWWRKERLNQAVLQLAVRNQQRYLWWGYQDIFSLSGGNITVFLHICHRIWDGFLKNESSLPPNERTDIFLTGSIHPNIQSAGILAASNEWYRKLPEEPGGDSRQRFIEQFGTCMYKKMTSDLSMSYPGGNGISVAISDGSNEDEERVICFMKEAVGYGALFATEHSSRSKRGGKRMKYYLNPILCPRFQLPETRTKEPHYWSFVELFDLFSKANVGLPMSASRNAVVSNSEDMLPGLED